MMILDDILAWAASYDGPPFHALLCDAPYHLTSITERFGKPGAAPAQPGTDGAFQRASKGFMGKTWDGGDIAFQASTWAALAQHMYPGAFGMAFAGSRGWHRMAVAIEDAGLIIHPSVFVWCYGSGFPKATRIDVQVDRASGAERPVIGSNPNARPNTDGHGRGYSGPTGHSPYITAPGTELAADWQGHRYGLQALKPAVEPVIVFQKPYAGRPVDSIVATGAGALNIDAGRIDGLMNGNWGGRQLSSNIGYNGKTRPAEYRTQEHPSGRWPANFALSHAPGCASACVEECPVRRLGEQSGESVSTASMRGEFHGHVYGGGKGLSGPDSLRGHGDSVTAARYFVNADWTYEIAERLYAADPVAYHAKSSAAEREAGLEPAQIAILREFYGADDDDHAFDETTVDDGRQTPIDNPYLRGETTRRNTHPTIKPLALSQWLASLLLPPDRYAPRRLLIPFAGAGSEYIGAMAAGWEDITGIELEAEHVRIAEARIAFWARVFRQTHSRDIAALLRRHAGQPKRQPRRRPPSGASGASAPLFDLFESED